MKYSIQTMDLLGIPKVRSLEDLAFHTSLSVALLHRIIVATEKFYVEIDVPKKNGSTRKLACPSPKVKAIQAWLLRNILDKIEVHEVATAFNKKRTVVDNVSPHIDNRYFLCLDLENFFDNISFLDVFFVFRALGYDKQVSRILANLCIYKNRLPQGGVTSPALSNIVCINLDNRLSKLVGSKNIVYTRYADDMTFSAKNPETLIRVKKTIEEIIESEGFKINDLKTRFLGPRKQLKITGLVISNNKTLGIGKKQKKILRAAFYNNLINNKLSRPEQEKQALWMVGWLCYLKSVDKIRFEDLSQYVMKLLSYNTRNNIICRKSVGKALKTLSKM